MDEEEIQIKIKTNLKNRLDVLDYALVIEDSIDSLLLLCLGILKKKNYKEFGMSKPKLNVSFQSKIDLLFDIDILSKDEHSDLELLMNFRNKFLHYIKCDSYLSVVSLFDNGIKNRFKMHLNKGGNLNDEESCKKGYFNLYGTNIKTIHKKIIERRIQLKNKADLIKTLLGKNIRIIDLSFNFIGDLLKMMEKAELENPKIFSIAGLIMSKCEAYTQNFEKDKKIISLNKKMERLFSEKGMKEFMK
jgi:hypothetical protein